MTSLLEYAYVPNSDLVAGYEAAIGMYGATVTVARTYEPNRNLILAVSNLYNGFVVSAFDYMNDAAGRRVQRVDCTTSGVSHVTHPGNVTTAQADSRITASSSSTSIRPSNPRHYGPSTGSNTNTFTRHSNRTLSNVLFGDGTVRPMDTASIDPGVPGNYARYWEPQRP